MLLKQCTRRWSTLLLNSLHDSIPVSKRTPFHELGASVLARALSRGTQESTLVQEESSIAEKSETSPSTTRANNSQISSVVNHSALIVTRDIEWGTVLLGFEQANKYTVLDEEGERVALIAEDITGIGNAVARQLLRTRRSFTATVFNAEGNQVIFRIRRPAYLISSSMFVETGAGEVIGEIQQRWHLWRRNYDLYIDRKQFAKIEGNFLAWEFELKNESGGTLALIDRNFQGFGKELFTDAGKYVIHFGQDPNSAAEAVTETLKARTNNPSLPPVTALARVRTGVKVIPSFTGNQLIVAKNLSLNQRMISLACAMTIDYDYFSTHSTGTGYFAPPLFMPLPGGGTSAPATEEPATTGEAPEMSTGGETEIGGAGEELLVDDESWSPDTSEMLDSGEGGGGIGQLFENLKDVFGDS